MDTGCTETHTLGQGLFMILQCSFVVVAGFDRQDLCRIVTVHSLSKITLYYFCVRADTGKYLCFGSFLLVSESLVLKHSITWRSVATFPSILEQAVPAFDFPYCQTNTCVNPPLLRSVSAITLSPARYGPFQRDI
jgi:hypothetical protein